MKRLVTWLVGSFALLFILAAYGCGGMASTPEPLATATVAVAPAATNTAVVLDAATASPTMWVPPTALVGTPRPGTEATLTAAPQLQMGKLTITNSVGEPLVISVEIADTEPSRELGLMFRSSMPTDAGMLFDFGGETTGGFWMQNTILPLSIAFIGQDGAIVSISDMEALNTDTVNPAGPYYYALEANQGFFRANNINPGDKATLPVDMSVLTPGMPDVGK